MAGPGSWAERVRGRPRGGQATSRRRGLALLDASALDDHLLEFRFVPNYLDGREVVLVLDGQARFADDFLADGPDEAHLALEDWPVEEQALRTFLLGMQEPFPKPETLARSRRPLDTVDDGVDLVELTSQRET